MIPASNSKNISRVEILARYEQFKSEHPKARARDIASRLNLSEAELLGSRTGDSIIRLEGSWIELIKALPELGRVMALTRNEHCVHEKYGKFDNISIGPGHGLVLNKDIDLRLFMSHWHYGFAVTEEVASGLRKSLQFFDIDGQAVHKVYIPKDGDDSAYQTLVSKFSSNEQEEEINVVSLPAGRIDEPDEELEIETFLTHWENLKDTHHFFGMLAEFGIGRRQSMRLAEDRFTRQIPNDCLDGMLNEAVSSQTSIMCFVGNPGCIQIHTGEINKVATMGSWLNILDSGFNLHLNQGAIESIWAVKKPTVDGIVTSIEIYDQKGNCFCQFFGERKPGKTELKNWQNIVAGISSK